jgi:hypothetical protein
MGPVSDSILANDIRHLIDNLDEKIYDIERAIGGVTTGAVRDVKKLDRATSLLLGIISAFWRVARNGKLEVRS